MEKENGLAIASTYVEMLSKEGNKALDICADLNKNPGFKDGLLSLAADDHKSVVYKAEHVLLHDIVSLFNGFNEINIDDDVSIKTKFILIYLYEKLQGTDLKHIYDLDEINYLTTSPRFDKNLEIIRNTVFFEPLKEMKGALIMPVVLSKIQSDELPGVVSLVIRIVSMIVKADNVVSPQEEAFLRQVTDRLNNPKMVVKHAGYESIPEDDSMEKVLSELDGLIGLDEIKKSVKDITNFLKVQKIREAKGLKTSTNTLHAVFMGPPGTGKTTVARKLGRIYKHLGYLKKGHLIETDRAGMVAGYVGQTAIKADEVIKSAENGVLFIDEAYSLTSGGLNDFGREAVEILLKRMEDLRDNLVVVVAGYSEEMGLFIQSNPGLQSRFNRYFEFDHFDEHGLLKIFKLYAQKADFVLTEDAEDKLKEILERVYEKRHRGFGNARSMRNLFEKIIERQANRIVSITPISEEILITLTEEDIPEILKTVEGLIMNSEEPIA